MLGSVSMIAEQSSMLASHIKTIIIQYNISVPTADERIPSDY